MSERMKHAPAEYASRTTCAVERPTRLFWSYNIRPRCKAARLPAHQLASSPACNGCAPPAAFPSGRRQQARGRRAAWGPLWTRVSQAIAAPRGSSGALDAKGRRRRQWRLRPFVRLVSGQRGACNLESLVRRPTWGAPRPGGEISPRGRANILIDWRIARHSPTGGGLVLVARAATFQFRISTCEFRLASPAAGNSSLGPATATAKRTAERAGEQQSRRTSEHETHNHTPGPLSLPAPARANCYLKPVNRACRSEAVLKAFRGSRRRCIMGRTRPDRPTGLTATIRISASP